MIVRSIIFLIINFLGLGVGSFFTKKGVSSTWYQSLSKAPWTPPGWVFGVAWTCIMICFATYMAFVWKYTVNTKTLILLFATQWLLNALWNPVFFYYHNTTLALIIIIALLILITIFIGYYWKSLTIKSLFIAPYFVWLLIATSLNFYIVLKN